MLQENNNNIQEMSVEHFTHLNYSNNGMENVEDDPETKNILVEM